MNFVKSKVKFIFALLFVFVISLSLVACKDNKGDDNNDPKEQDEPVVENRVVNGEVVCGDEKISGATVKIRNTSYTVTTDADGKFSITITESESDLPEFRLMVTATGYEQATKDITAASFDKGVANVKIELVSANVVVNGKVTDKTGAILAGVKVVIANTDFETTTDANGNYSFELERPKSVTLEFSKDYYKTKSLEIADLSTGVTFTNDVILEDNLVTISGKVFNYYSGVISGAEVSIEGTDYKATSAADGTYKIENVLAANEEFNLVATKEGFLAKKQAYAEENDIELVADYYDFAHMDLYDDNELEGYVTKSSEGLYFKFILDEFRYEAGKEEKVQLYINPGQYTESSRQISEECPDGGHAIEIALTSNNAIVVFVNYYRGTNFITNILWGTELIYTVNRTDDGKVALDLYIKYSVFGDYCGADFAINADSVIGMGLNFYSYIADTALYHWSVPEMLGADGKAIVDHANPQDWVRLAKDGHLVYEGASNEPVEFVERTVTGKVTEAETVKQAKADLDSFVELAEGESYEALYKGANAKVEIVDGKLITTVEGSEVFMNDSDQLSVFVKFNTDTIYEIKFNNGWVGVHNGTDWEAWNDKISNPVYNKDAGLKITQTSNLAFFSDLGCDVSTAKVCLATAEFERELPVEGVVVAVPQFGTKATFEKEATMVKADQATWADFISGLNGTKIIGGKEVTITAKIVDGILTSTFVGEEGFINDSDQLSVFITFEDGTIYEIKFNNGWVGVHNGAAWETWNGKIGNPSYATAEGKLTITQVSDLMFFADLGRDISAVKGCIVGVEYKATLPASEAESYELEYNVYAITDANGNYTLTIPADKMAVKSFELLFAKEGYVDLKGTVREFNENVATHDAQIVEGKTAITVFGYVKDSEGNPISGAKVTIQGTSIFVLTDANGYYIFDEVEYDVIPYTLVASCDLFYANGAKVEVLISESNVDFVLDAKPATIETAPVIELDANNKLLGTAGVDAIKVYAKTVDGNLVLTYVYAEGAVTLAPEELFKVFFNFKGSDVIYSVRSTSGGWCGIYNENTKKYETWLPEIGIPTIVTADGIATATQVLDLSYFAALGNDLSEIHMSFAEKSVWGDRELVYNDEYSLSVTNTAKYMTIKLPETAKAEGITVELGSDAKLVGKIGDVTVELSAANNVLTTKLTGVTDGSLEWSVYLTFDGDTVYEVRFKSGWVGIWNLKTSSWETWNGKVGNPTYDGEVVTQVTDLAFFSELGCDLTNVKAFIAQGANAIKYPVEKSVAKSDKTTWIDIVADETKSGKIGEVQVNVALAEGKLTTTLTGTIDANTEWSVYYTFDGETVYEVRFKSGWVGIWNVTTSVWEGWTAKVANPVYGEGTASQETDLSFFSDLGCDLTSISICPAQGATPFKFEAENAAVKGDKDTWMILVFPAE